MLVGSMSPALAGAFKTKGGAGLLEELGNKVQKETEKAELKAAKKADAAARNSALEAATSAAADAAKAVGAAEGDKTPKSGNPVALEASKKTGSASGTNPRKPVEQASGSSYLRPEVEEVQIDDVAQARQEALKAQEKLKIDDMISSLTSVDTRKAVALLQPAAEGAGTSYSDVVSAYAENAEEAA
ncbi:hypothetical protein [Nitratireductor basaltis]|nr:hypothetical protein [Nitratireductor basaltis]